MVDVIGRAKVIITGDVDAGSIDKAGSTIGSKLKVGAAVGVAALGTLAVAGVKAFKAFEEGEAASAKLSTVLGNMNKTGAVESVEKLATSISRATGVSDELIQGGQTILATFSEIAASAGDVGGVFERATRASVDLAAAGFGTVESASVMLGKALQAPVQGVSALGEAGVTFTEDQKELIKSLVETGDVAGAQAIILAEVEKQVKGVGEASKKESVLIGEAMGEIEQSAGKALAALLGGEGKTSLSDELFKLSDAINELASSDDWKTFGKDLRGTARDIATIGGAIIKLRGEGNKLMDRWGIWAEPIRIFLNPIGDVISRLGDAIRKFKEWRDLQVTGDDVPDAPDISQPRSTRASGGPARGLTLVGENGPELAMFSGSGGYVYNNSQTRDMLSKASAASVTINNVFNGPENLAQARRNDDWAVKYGTRFGAATNAGAM